MKLKKLLTLALLMTGVSTWAQTDAEYADANASIEVNGVYKIYTYSNGTETGSTPYYLKPDGYLTDDASAAGQFTFDFQRIFGGFKMGGYRINQFTNGGKQDNSFSGDALKKIMTTGQNRVDWEAQVFFKNNDGYAIRSTNATSSQWGASAFWTVVADNDEDGLPNATYTVDAVPFVWQLEKVTAGDWSDVTAKYISNYNPTTNGNGWDIDLGTSLGNWAGNNYNSGNNVAEFYRRGGATFKQTLNSLPNGYYTLTALAFTRTNYTTTLSAGDDYSMSIATVGSGDVNNVAGANTWLNNGNGVNELPFAVDATSNVTIGLTMGSDGDAWTIYRAFYLTYNSEPVALRKALAQAKNTANTALGNASYETVTGYERTQLTASVAKTVDETQAPSAVTTAYNNLIEEIATNLAAFTAAPNYYTQLTAANTKAAEFGLAAQTTESQSAQSALDVQSKAIYNKVVTEYNTIIDLGAWQTEGEVGTMTSQHWDGTSTSSYNEQSSAAYSATSWTLKYYQTINLPAGDYVFKVAGRHSASASLELNVKKGETVLGTVNDFPAGDTGYGINKAGVPSFFGDDAAGFARDGRGGGWQWRYVPFTITEENADITISIDGSSNAQYQWLGFCNYTVQSAPSVAASTIAYNQAKEAAIAARDNATYANVQGTDRSGLVAAINADKGSTIVSIDAATAALQSATSTFTAAKTSWDNLANARTNVSGVLPYASSTKKSALDAAVAAEVTGAAADAQAQVAVIEQANRQYVESNALAEGVAGATNVTNLITNPNADENADGWSGEFGRLAGEQFTQGDGTLGGGYFDKNGASSYTAEQTISNLAPGKYLLTVTARAQSGATTYKVKAVNSRNEEFTADIPAVGNQGGVFGRGFNDASVVLEQNFTGDATIGITASNSGNFWLSFDRVRLVRIADSDVTLADATDYTNLTAAINAVKDNVIGFDKDEYAPYNNAAAIVALAAAQDINQEIENAQNTVQSATTTLTSATWNQNATEVNAVYNGDFAATENNAAPAGWTSTKSGAFSGQYMPRVFNNDNRLAEMNETKSAFFIRFDGTNSDRGTLYKYGETENYTMPLKASTTYYVKADVKDWGYTGKPLRLNVSGPEGFEAKYQELTLSSRADTDDEAPQQFLIVFTTTTAGNYTINFQCPGSDDNKHNAVVSNIELKRADGLAFAVTDAKWSTFVAPFAVQVPDGFTAYTVDDIEGNTLTMNSVTNIAANQPVVLYADAADSKTVYGYSQPDATPTYGLLTGTYTDIDAPNGSYVLQNQEGKVGFYQVDTNEATPKVRANRAYLTAPAGGEVKAFYLGGGEDAIKSVFEGVAAGEVYDLSGRKLSKLQRGVNIVTGKKVIVK